MNEITSLKRNSTITPEETNPNKRYRNEDPITKILSDKIYKKEFSIFEIEVLEKKLNINYEKNEINKEIIKKIKKTLNFSQKTKKSCLIIKNYIYPIFP